MKLTLLLPLLLTACAPQWAQNVQTETLARVDVRHANIYRKSYYSVPQGQHIVGNCSDVAATSKTLAEAEGYEAYIMPCPKLKHVFTVVRGQDIAFDARFKQPVSFSTAVRGCF